MDKGLQVTKIDSANALIEATIPQNILEQKLKNLAKQASKTLKIDGFRKGHVPLQIVQSRLGQSLEDDAIKACVQDLLKQALEQLKTSPQSLIGDPKITKFDKTNTNITLSIEIGLAPDIELGDLSSYIPKVTLPTITQEEIDKQIEQIAIAKAPLIGIEDSRRKLKNGEFAKIDFEGFIDGKPFEGAKAQNYLLEIGSNSFIEGFEEQLIGMKKNEQKEIQVTFPQNYQAQNLAGKDAVFKVTLHEIQTKGKIEIDDNFAKTLFPDDKNASVQTLQEKVKEQLRLTKKQELYDKELKPQLINNLESHLNFDLPKLIIEQEMDLSLRNFFLSLSKAEQEQLANNKEELEKKREEQRENAQKSVKVTFIIDAIAKAEQIQIADNEVINVVYYEALRNGQDPKQLLEHYQKNNLLPAVKMAILEDRVLTNLLDKSAK